jgi:hypothetical protein
MAWTIRNIGLLTLPKTNRVHMQFSRIKNQRKLKEKDELLGLTKGRSKYIPRNAITHKLINHVVE